MELHVPRPGSISQYIFQSESLAMDSNLTVSEIMFISHDLLIFLKKKLLLYEWRPFQKVTAKITTTWYIRFLPSNFRETMEYRQISRDYRHKQWPIDNCIYAVSTENVDDWSNEFHAVRKERNGRLADDIFRWIVQDYLCSKFVIGQLPLGIFFSRLVFLSLRLAGSLFPLVLFLCALCSFLS